jgi:hypothetical protein
MGVDSLSLNSLQKDNDHWMISDQLSFAINPVPWQSRVAAPEQIHEGIYLHSTSATFLGVGV